MADMYSHNQEQQVKKLKRLLEGWRMAVLPLKSIFLWEQQWHPCAIVGTTSFLYFIIWLMDFNFLTSLAFVGLLINFFDFIVPIICNSVCNPNSWTGQKEKMFEDTCKSLVGSYNKVCYNIVSFYSMRETNPLMYYIISISLLCSLAFISSTINNTLLVYVFSTTVLLWPGMQKRGIFNITLSIFSKNPIKSE